MTKSLFLKIAISAALLVALALQVDFSRLMEMAGKINPISWVLAVSFIILQMGALSYRWMLLVNADSRAHINLSTSWRITAVSFIANYLFITSLGGIIARVGLTMHYGFLFVKALAATVIDRAFTLLALIILTVICLPLIPGFFSFSEHMIFILAALVVSGLVALLVLYKARRKIIFFHRKITVAFKYMRGILKSPLLIAKITATSLIAQLMYFISVYILLIALGAEFPFIKFIAVMPAITLASSLPLGYGGWGVREGAFIYGLGLIGVPAEVAFAAGIATGLVGMFTAFLTGIPAFINDETQAAVKNFSLKQKN